MKAIFNHRTKGSAIYLIPSLLTLGAMCCGFFAIVVSYQGKFIECTYLIFFAMVFDSLDGRVARLTHTSSPFGAELDSLSDMVNFGIAPAIIIYNWNLHSLDRIGGIVVFAYAACVALRLARFNTMVSIVDKRFFLGLPCTAAAPVIVGYVWMCVVYHLNSSFFIIFGLILTLFIGFSMVSLVKFYSFKEIHFSRKTRFRALLIFLVILALLIIWPEFVVFGFFVFYVIVSYVLFIFKIGYNSKKNIISDKKYIKTTVTHK